MEDKEREEKENKIVEDYGKNARIILDIINKKKEEKKKEDRDDLSLQCRGEKMENSTKQALRELYDIICHMDQEIRKKIPDEFVSYVENNMDIRI